MSDYAIDQDSYDPFEIHLKKQMVQWDREAEELAATLGVAKEARYELVAVIHGQIGTPDAAKNSLSESMSEDRDRQLQFEKTLSPVYEGLGKTTERQTKYTHMGLGVSPEDSDPRPEEVLVLYDQYIVALVKQRALRTTNFAKPGQFDLEVDEMVQRVRIKFWQALIKKHIEYPKAYLRAIVWDEFHALSRNRKQPLQLLTDDEGEWYTGDAKELDRAWEMDPADRFEESEELDELMDSTAGALAKLAPRQQQAMICQLYEKMDTTLHLIQALRNHQIEVKTVEWPENQADKALLKASLSPARHKMAKYMDFDIRGHKGLTLHR